MSIPGRFGQSQYLWRHFRDIMSPCLGGVFRPMKEAIFTVLCHSSTASVCGSFARYYLAFSGLSQAS